jgi:hypothetical protein
MVVNVAENIKPVSYIESNASDAFALLNIIKLAEDDIKTKRTRKASVVFSEIENRLQEQAK